MGLCTRSLRGCCQCSCDTPQGLPGNPISEKRNRGCNFADAGWVISMWKLADQTLKSRLILGSALFPSLSVMREAIQASGAQVITLAVRRQMPNKQAGLSFWNYIKDLGCHLLPNTAGCKTADEAVMIAQMTRELFNTHWIKLEVIGDDYNLQPDPLELIKAAKILVKEGFEVFPYCTEDLVLCQYLIDCGCRTLMPWGAPIGSGQGLLNPYALTTLRQRLPEITLIIDAGIGVASDAVRAMEMGYDGVLLNSAIALAHDPVKMAQAFKYAVAAGHEAHRAGRMPKREMAKPSTPLVDTPFWEQGTKS